MKALQAVGFTKYEAKAYGALVQEPNLNGYELAKRTGIPRANIYAVLNKLLERGAVLRLEHKNGSRYAAIDPSQLLAGIESGQQQALAQARRDLAALTQHQKPSAVFNLQQDEWLSQARRSIDNATRSLLIAIQPKEAAQLAASLRSARERGVEITTLCLESCPGNCGHCQGQVYCYNFQQDVDERWLVLVADEQALVARLDAPDTEAILTTQPLVVRLASAYIQQSLTLALLGSDLSDRFEGLLSIETRRLIDGLYPQHDFIAWLRGVNGCAG